MAFFLWNAPIAKSYSPLFSELSQSMQKRTLLNITVCLKMADIDIFTLAMDYIISAEQQECLMCLTA